MLTDLRLQKYLQGLLSEEEAKEVEALVAKSPEVKARLEALQAQSEIVGRPMWQRVLMDRKSRRGGSRTRATILLPILIAVAVIFSLSRHWFSPPGENSTFIMSGGNATSLEILYNSASGWKFLDAAYREKDSLTFSVRDGGKYHVAVKARYGLGKDAEVVPILEDAPDRTYDKQAPTPAFLAEGKAGARPSQIIVFYDDTPLPELPVSRVLDIVDTKGNERGGLDFQYQVFSSGP